MPKDKFKYIVTNPPRDTPLYMPPVARYEGSNWVTILGVIPSGLTADQAIEIGHRLVEAGLGARPES